MLFGAVLMELQLTQGIQPCHGEQRHRAGNKDMGRGIQKIWQGTTIHVLYMLHLLNYIPYVYQVGRFRVHLLFLMILDALFNLAHFANAKCHPLKSPGSITSNFGNYTILSAPEWVQLAISHHSKVTLDDAMNHFSDTIRQDVAAMGFDLSICFTAASHMM